MENDFKLHLRALYEVNEGTPATSNGLPTEDYCDWLETFLLKELTNQWQLIHY